MKLEGTYYSREGVHPTKFLYILKKLLNLLLSDLPSKKFYLPTTNHEILRFMLLCEFDVDE